MRSRADRERVDISTMEVRLGRLTYPDATALVGVS